MEQQTARETDMCKEVDVSPEIEKSGLKGAIIYVCLTSLF
jgi:hypothetical protein